MTKQFWDTLIYFNKHMWDLLCSTRFYDLPRCPAQCFKSEFHKVRRILRRSSRFNDVQRMQSGHSSLVACPQRTQVSSFKCLLCSFSIFQLPLWFATFAPSEFVQRHQAAKPSLPRSFKLFQAFSSYLKIVQYCICVSAACFLPNSLRTASAATTRVTPRQGEKGHSETQWRDHFDLWHTPPTNQNRSCPGRKNT